MKIVDHPITVAVLFVVMAGLTAIGAIIGWPIWGTLIVACCSGFYLREAILAFARPSVQLPLGTEGVLVGLYYAKNEDGSATFLFGVRGATYAVAVAPDPFESNGAYGDVVVFNGRAIILMRGKHPATLHQGQPVIPTVDLHVIDAKALTPNAAKNFVGQHYQRKRREG